MEEIEIVVGNFVRYTGDYGTCRKGVYEVVHVYERSLSVPRFYDLELISKHEIKECVFKVLNSVQIGELESLDPCEDLGMHNPMPRVGFDNVHISDVCVECGKEV